MLAETKTSKVNHSFQPLLDIRLGEITDLAPEAEQVAHAHVFVGGSGKKVLKSMLRQCSGRLPPKTHVAVVDSDPDRCGLPRERVVTLTVPQADFLVARRKEWPSIDRSLPERYRAGKVTRGSSMKRMVTAGVVLPYHRRRLRREIRKRIVRPLLTFEGVGQTRLRGGRPLVVVNLVGSLGGGFGSATKDEIPALIRDEFRRVHEGIDVVVVWHVFTSNVHHDVLPLEWQKSRADANCFAALLEFEAGYADPAKLPWESMGIEPFLTPLINKVMVYDPANEQGDLLEQEDDMYAMLATALLTQSSARLSDTLGAHEANDPTSPHELPPYGSTVAYRLVFPARKIEHFALLEAVRRLVTSAFAAGRLQGGELEAVALEKYQVSSIPNLPGRLASDLKLPALELPTPSRKEELEMAPDTLRALRRDLDRLALPALERRAVGTGEGLAKEVGAKLQRTFREMCAAPSRNTPVDVAAVFDEMLKATDKLLAATQGGLAELDLAARAADFDRSLAALREALEMRTWYGGGRRARRACLEAGSLLSHYAGDSHRAVLLRATADVLGRLRPLLLRLGNQARETAKAGEAASAALEIRARQAGGQIGRHEIFVREVVDENWARDCVAQLFAGIDWARWADEVLGGKIAQFRGLQDMEGFLNGEGAAAVAAVVRPKVSEFHVTSEEMGASASRWLQEVLEKAVPQFAFHEAKCGEDGQTYFSHMLAVRSRADAERLLRQFPGDEPEVVETGDPHQIVYLAQRRLVPLHAAVNNLGALEREYRRWMALAEANPQAQILSNRVYTDAGLDVRAQQTVGRSGAAHSPISTSPGA